MAQLVGSNSLGLGKLIDGKNQFVHIMYSANVDGSNMTSDIQADTKYIGIVTSNSETAPTNPSDYSWGRFVGTSGTSSYTWLRYSPNEDGSNMTANPTPETKYIGVAITADNNAPTDYTKYSWALIKGDNGRGISKTEVTYQKSTSGTVIPTGTWVTTIPTVNAGEYLWTRTLFTYTDNTTSSTYSVARSGVTGLGISRSDVDYKKSTSGTVAPTGAWTATIPTVAANEYLWTRTTLTYTNATTSVSYSVGKMGADGKDAQLLYLTASSQIQAFDKDNKPKATQAITISAKLQNASGTATFVAIPYIGNTAQTAITLGGTGNDRTLLPSQWTNTQWTTIAITATLGSLTDTISVARVKDGDTGATGKDGVAGKDGVGLKSTAIQYAQSTSGTTAPTTGWATNVPTLAKGQYLWTKTVWTYTDNSSETGYTVSYNAKDGNTGKDGIAGKDGVGISNTVIEYVGAVSGTSKPTSGWSTTIPTVPQGQYLWTRTTWTYTDGTTEQGYSTALMGPKGDKGDTGAKGTDGKDGAQGVPGQKGADGKTSYLHTGWKMADGTFTTEYPGENLLLNTSDFTSTNNWGANDGTTISVEEGCLSVYKSTTSDYRGVAQTISVPEGAHGKRFRLSTTAKGASDNTALGNGVIIHYLSGSGVLVSQQSVYGAPNLTTEFQHLKYTYATVPEDTSVTKIRVIFKYANEGTVCHVLHKNFKLAFEDSASIYTPSPTDDYLNAYPKYRGEYTDFTAADSTNPDDYTWTAYLGQTPVVHPAWSWSADGTDRFTTSYPGENLILGSADFSSGLLSSQSIVIDGTEHGIKNKIVKCTVPADGLSYYDAWTYRAYGATKTGKYTLMFKAKASVDRATLTSFFYNPNTTTNMVNSQGQSSTRSDGQSSFNLTTEWQDIWVTWTQSETASAKSMILARCSRGPQDIDFYMTEPILVEGSVVPTIYTPAPSEDYANAYPLYEGTYTDYSDTASQNPADYTWRRIIGESGQDGIAGEDGSNGINGDGQLVFNNRYERWPVSTSSSDNLVQTGWSYNANIEIIDAKSDFPAQKIARTKQRGSGTVQFWTTGIPVVPGTYVRWRGQVLTTEDMTPVGSKSFACARFFKSDVPDATSSAAASEINGERTSVYLRHTGLADVGNSPVVISQDIPVITTAGIEYDFEVVMEVPEGAAWLKVSSYADWISPTQQYEYRNFTVVAYQKGDNGLPAYVHNAWANSSDGTVDFTTVYPGENILLGSQPEITMIGNGLENQLPSNRYLLFSDSNLPAADRLTLADLGFKTGDKITFSAEYEISGSGFSGEFSFRLGSAPWVLVSPGKARIKITKAGTFKIQETVDITEDMLGNTYLDSRLDKVPTTVNITVRNRKLEKGGNLNPIYTPSPTDDPSGAYIKYMGTCSNHSETAPTEPSVYHWEVDPTYLKAITDGKVDQDSYEDEKGNIYEILDGKAGTDEFQSLKDQANALQNSYEAFLSDGGKYEHDLESLENRAVGLINQLNDKIAQYEFINTYIRLGEEGLVIGAQNDPMKMLLTKDTLSFIDNGKTVAYFSGQSFYINRGAIVESLQVGSHKMTKIDGNNTVFQFIG